MTAIIGYSNSKGVWLGADSAVSFTSPGGEFTETDTYAKVRRLVVKLASRKVPMLVGIAGSITGETAFISSLKKMIRSKTTVSSGKAYVETHIAPLLRQLDLPEDDAPEIVVGICGGVYELYCGGLLKLSSGIAAVGSGDVVCRAAMLSAKLLHPHTKPETLILNALQVAHTLMPGSIGPPFKLLRL